jgi:hypothetical protein
MYESDYLGSIEIWLGAGLSGKGVRLLTGVEVRTMFRAAPGLHPAFCVNVAGDLRKATGRDTSRASECNTEIKIVCVLACVRTLPL